MAVDFAQQLLERRSPARGSCARWALPASGAVAASAASAAQASDGAEVFKTACVACHGEDGKGGQGGGAPLDKVTDVAMVVAMVTDGRGNMPPLGDALTAEQIRAVAAYIVNDLFKQQPQ